MLNKEIYVFNSLFKIQGKTIIDMFIPAFHSQEEKTLSNFVL